MPRYRLFVREQFEVTAPDLEAAEEMVKERYYRVYPDFKGRPTSFDVVASVKLPPNSILTISPRLNKEDLLTLTSMQLAVLKLTRPPGIFFVDLVAAMKKESVFMTTEQLVHSVEWLITHNIVTERQVPA